MIKLITIDRAGAGWGVDWQDCYHTEESFITKKSLIHDNRVVSLLIITFSHPRILLIFLCHSITSKLLVSMNLSWYFLSVKWIITWHCYSSDLLVPEHPGLLLLGTIAWRHGVHPVGRMRGGPVLLQPAAQVLAGLLQIVLVEDDVPHLQRTLGKLLSCHHLYIHVLGLRLSTWFNQSL